MGIIADRSVIVRIGGNVTGLVSAFKTGTQAAQDFGTKTLDRVERNKASISQLSTGIGVVGLALTGMASLAVKKFADFDQAMSNVAATGDDARQSIDALREASIEAGKRTVFSASEAAGAVEELSKAGVSAADILGGGLNGALDLAAAGGIGVADAAGIASVALKQFKLDGTQTTHVADLLAAGAGKAMGGVDDLGMALKQSGLVASQTGLTIEETTGALSAFASAGLLGSDAGTSLKTMLQRLTPQSKEAQAQFDALGISAYDANGKFVGLSEFAGQLKDKMKDLTPEARNAAMSVMFGSDAVRAASVLYDEGAAGIDGWITAVDDSGYAAETAATRLDNLKGDIEQFTGSLETAMIKTGEGANGPMRSLVQSATDIVNSFADAPAAVQGVTLALTGGGGLVLLGVAGLGKLAVGISETRTAMKALGLSAKTTSIAVGGVGAVLAIATVGVIAWATANAEARGKIDALADTLDMQTGALTENSTAWISSELTKDQSFGIRNTKSMAEAAKEMGISLDTLTRAYEGQPAAMATAKKSAKDYADANFDLGLSAASLSDRFIRNIDDQSGRLKDASEIVKTKNQIDGDSATKQDAVATATEAVTAATEAQTKALDEWRKMVADADASFVNLDDAYQSVIDKNTEVATSTADATKSSKDSWSDYYDGVSVSAEDYIGQLQAQVDAQGAWETNILAITDRVKTGMTGDMADAATGMIDELLQLGPKGAAEVALLKSMTDEQFAQVVTLWSQKGTAAVSEFTSKVESYRQPVITPTVDLDPARTAIQALLRTPATFHVGVSALPGSADGGAISGPGTGTSDSIVSRLSNGEHVLTASDVQKAGGQSAIYAWRAQIQKGYANGGAVQQYASRQYVAAPQYASARSSAAISQPYTGPLVTVGQVVQGTPQDVGREVAWAMLGRN